ncbi:MAG: hypothetical protein AAB518_01840 [Patescibacteria group bacterium]
MLTLQYARVTKSVPMGGFGFAKTTEGTIVFLRVPNAGTLFIQGTEVKIAARPPAGMTIPSNETPILFEGTIPANCEHGHPQAMRWVLADQYSKTKAGALKAGASLAEVTARCAKAERRRQETILRCRKGPGKDRGEKHNKKSRAGV